MSTKAPEIEGSQRETPYPLSEEASLMIYAGRFQARLNEVIPYNILDIRDAGERIKAYKEIAAEAEGLNLPENFLDSVVERMGSTESQLKEKMLMRDFFIEHGLADLASYYEDLPPDALREVFQLFPQARSILVDKYGHDRFLNDFKEHGFDFPRRYASLKQVLLLRHLGLPEEDQVLAATCLLHDFTLRGRGILDLIIRDEHEGELARVPEAVVKEWNLPHPLVVLATQAAVNKIAERRTYPGIGKPKLGIVEKVLPRVSLLVDEKEIDWSKWSQETISEAFFEAVPFLVEIGDDKWLKDVRGQTSRFLGVAKDLAEKAGIEHEDLGQGLLGKIKPAHFVKLYVGMRIVGTLIPEDQRAEALERLVKEVWETRYVEELSPLVLRLMEEAVKGFEDTTLYEEIKSWRESEERPSEDELIEQARAVLRKE